MPRPVLQLWRFAQRILEAYTRHHGSSMAAAVSFFALLSILPLLAVGVALLGWTLGDSEEAIRRLARLVQAYLPTDYQPLIIKTLLDIQRDRNIFGLIGLLGLLYTAGQLFMCLTLAFNQIWDVHTRESWLKRRFMALCLELLALVLLLSSLALTSFLTYIQTAPLTFLGIHLSPIPYLWSIAGYLLPLLLSMILFTLLYRLLPGCLVRWSDALVGASFASVVWELSKILFGLYVAHFNNYSRVYGTLGGIALLMMWAYFSSMILLLGAEIAADRGKRHKTQRKRI
jgi:membrane protein